MATSPRLVSPDGKFYWDGQRWVPMESQPPDWSAPRWSPDGRYWWDGANWVPVNVASITAPTKAWEPSPGLRSFLLVVLVIADVITGFFAVIGLLHLAYYLGRLGFTHHSASTDLSDPGLSVFFVLLFSLTLAATIGVVRRSAWARVLALVAGVVLSFTCLGLVLGIPILVCAARAPLKKEVPPSTAGP